LALLVAKPANKAHSLCHKMLLLFNFYEININQLMGIKIKRRASCERIFGRVERA